jgi:phage terminase large subunit-like protein
MAFDKKELDRIAAEKGKQCIESFYFFFKTFWPEMSGSKFIDAPHIKYLCDKLQYHATKIINQEFCNDTVIINVPPNSSKSTIVTIALGTWVWLQAPNIATTNVSYSARLSERHAKKARSITDSEKWHILFDKYFLFKFGKKFEITVQNQNEMVNNFKGERFNSSVGAAITGMHADIIAKDDMQNPQEAKSDSMRENANEWDEETLSSRHRNPMCWLDIIIAQRLHEDDLTGHTLNKNITIYQYQLPSEITNASKVIPEDALSLYTDGILDPNRRPREVLDTEKERMGSAAYTCQFLQAPFNLEEQAIKPSMFEIINERDDITFDLWIDGAYTKDTINDPTGIMVAGFKNNTLFIKSVYNVWKTLPELLKFIIELGDNRVFDPDNGRIFIEPKASGYSLAQYIESDTKYNFVLIGQNTSKDEKNIVQQGKFARHGITQPKAESGRIKLFRGNWNDDYLTQICGFPKAAHDEQVDNTGYAVNHYFMNQNTFIEQYALNRLEKVVPDSVPVNITSQIDKFQISADYTENAKGDTQMFDYPNKLIKYRYVVSLVLTSDGERAGKTVAIVLDRQNNSVPAMFLSETIDPKKAGYKALELAAIYDNAKLIIGVKRETDTAKNEENDLSHIAINEIRKTRYDNIFSRLIQNSIKKTREKEYGFEINRSTTREVFYHLKDSVESNKVPFVPMEVFSEMKILERKKETGEIAAHEGYEANAVLAYAVALKVSDEMYDRPRVKRSEMW